MTKFYRWEVDGQLYGLLRRRDNGELAYAKRGEWVSDRTLLRDLIDPGDLPLDEITAAEAKHVAASLDVPLDADPADETTLGAD